MAGSAHAQFAVSVANQRNSCTTQDNGSIDIVIVNAASPTLTNIFGPVNFSNLAGGAGNHTHSLTGLKPSAPGFYVVVVQDASFNTVSTSFQITSITPGLSFNTPPVVSPNTICTVAPGPNGSIALDVTGGTGPYSYVWSGPTPAGNVSTATSLARGTYSVLITEAGSNCTLNGGPFVINDPGPLPFSISSTDLIICNGDNFVLTLDDTDLAVGGSAVSYQLFEAAVPLGAPVAGDGDDVSIIVSGLTPGPHTLYVEAQASQCGPVQSTNSLVVTVELPPVVTLGTMPAVCSGVTASSLSYSVTSGTPNEYSIDYDGVAEGQSFTDVVLTALPASPLPIVVPALAAPGLYNATLRVRDNVTGCFSDMAITVRIHPLPTITAVVDAQACLGAVTANLTYGGTTDSPNQYSLDFDGVAQAAGFIDVVNAVLSPPTAIVITIPGAATVGSYNANLTVRNSITGCVSLIEPIQVILNENASLTPGANPSVCSGTTTANLTYAAPTPTADRYSIDFDGTAEGQLFADVGLTVLPASPIVITVPAGALPATYNAVLRVSSSVTGCFTNHTITVTVLAIPTISLGANPAVCAGATLANLTYSATTANEYSLAFDAAAITAGFGDVAFTALAGAPSQIGIIVPAAAAPAPYNVTLTIRDTGTGCTSTFPVVITVNENPTITLDFTDPEVCSGDTSVDLTYSATTGTPDQYSIDFDATAQGQLFVDVVNGPLTASPIAIAVPAGAAAGTYNAILTIRNSTTGCVSANTAITVEVNPNPTITLGLSPLVCEGVTTANLPYTATTETPDQYTINFDASAETAGFIDVGVTLLTATPIVIAVPAAGPIGVYNGTVTVINSITGCSSVLNSFTVTIGVDVSVSAVADVCVNSDALIPYASPIGNPNRYSIDFDAAAEASGFVDVINSALVPSNITVDVPNGIAGVFNGVVSVNNSVTGCTSAQKPFTVTVGTTISVGTNPAVCVGSTSANVTYTATTGGPNQYSINFDAAAEAAGFADVTGLAITASPLVIGVPAAAPVATYNFDISVTNSVSGCGSIPVAMTVDVESAASAFAGVDQITCAGSNYLLAGSTIGNAASTGQWSITTQPTGGDGSVTPAGFVANPSTVAFTATVSGDYVLTLTTDDPAGTCLPAQDVVTITITAIPVLPAGQTKTICGNEEVGYEILLAPVNSPSNTVFNWADPDGAGPASAGTNVPMGAAGAIHINDRLINNGATDIIVTYQVTPSVGLCVGTQVSIAVTVRPSPLLDNQAPKTICSGDNVNYEIRLNPTNTPAGTTFSWPDPDGTASGTSQLNVPADPSGTIHITDVLYNGSGAPVNVIYSIIATAPNGCRAIPKDIVITVNSGAIAEAGPAQSICSSGTTTLGGSSIGGLATLGTWSILSGPAGGDGVLSVTTPTATPATVTFTAIVAGAYTLRLTTDDPTGSCVLVRDDVVITVRPVSDPACAGGIGGTGTCATVVIVPTPTAATCSASDGSIVFSINPFVPAVNTTGVRIDIVGTNAHNSTISRTIFNQSTFAGLPYGGYNYTIEYGDPSCIKTGTVTIARAGTVGVPTFSSPVNPVCFGSTGTVKIDVLGEAGNPLEWSADAVTWTPFIAGNTVTGIPGGTNTISVRRSSADACASGAILTLANPSQITTSVTPAPATCANNDGTITVTAVTGGTGPYTFQLNTAALTMPADNIVRALTAGSYNLRVTDAVGCSRTLTTSITFPGFVAHTAPVITPPDCIGGGANGIISLQITDTGSYEFGTTTDPVVPPASFTPTGGSTITVSNLINGTYAIWIQPVGAGTQCATKVGGLSVSGAYPVSVSATNTDVVCFDDKATIELSGFTGAPAVGYTYELTNTGTNVVSTGAITAGQALTAFTLSSVDPGNYSVRILQDQSVVAAACTAPIASAPVVLSVDGPTALLDTLAVVRTISYPDLATGMARVEVSPSGKEPYEARLELTAPQVPGQAFVQDWTAVDVNAQTLKYEHTFRNLYSGGYELRLVDAIGCEKIFSFSIGVDPTLMVPNIFTPNGDGVNEVFFIRNLPDNSALVITNRWGKEVYRSGAYSNDWDGGETVDGVYFYHLALPDQAITGWVEIHRGQ